MLLQKISIPLSWKVFELELPTPSGNSILVPYFPLKNWAFETPLPLGISVGMDIFWKYTFEFYLSSLSICEIGVGKSIPVKFKPSSVVLIGFLLLGAGNRAPI